MENDIGMEPLTGKDFGNLTVKRTVIVMNSFRNIMVT